MASQLLHYLPDFNTSTGDSLQDILEERSIRGQDLSLRIGLSPKQLDQLLKGQLALTTPIAEALERELMVPADFWLRREASFRALG